MWGMCMVIKADDKEENDLYGCVRELDDSVGGEDTVECVRVGFLV